MTRTAVEADLPSIKRIADEAKRCLGFVPRGALARAIAREEVVVATNRRGVAGFCHFYRRRDGVYTIYHMAVAATARQTGTGRRLTEHVLRDARRHGATRIRLKCPVDLEANCFYERAGFTRVGVESRLPRDPVLWECSLADRSG